MPHVYEPLEDNIALIDRVDDSSGAPSFLPRPAHRDDSSPISSFQLVSSVKLEEDKFTSSTRRRSSSTNSEDDPDSNSTLLPTNSIETGDLPPRPSRKQLTTIILMKSFIFILPSFIAPLFFPCTNAKVSSKLPPTAYLNGLRGVAAFCVYVQHYMDEYINGELANGFHARPQDVHLIQLPILRLIYTGRFMVSIFFILSGFVLSYKPLQLARARDDIALLNSLANSAFKRGPRLFLPCLVPMLVASSCIYFGWYGKSTASMKGILLTSTHKWYIGQLLETWWTFLRLANPFAEGLSWPATIPALWTITLEFHGSLLVFLIVLCFSRIRSSIRMICVAGIAMYAMNNLRWDFFLFVSGILLAELRLVRNASTYCLEDTFRNPTNLKVVRVTIKIFWTLVFIFGLYLGSWPLLSRNTPGYKTLSSLTPAGFIPGKFAMGFFWEAVGAVLLLFALENYEYLQRPFATSFARYMGDISFSLYIVHLPLLFTVARLLTPPLIQYTGSVFLSLCIGGLVMTPLVVWVADLQWRIFDENSVVFVKWLARICSE